MYDNLYKKAFIVTFFCYKNNLISNYMTNFFSKEKANVFCKPRNNSVEEVYKNT